MGTKTKKEYLNKLAIWNVLSAVDRKDYGYYDRLSEDEKKLFSPYLIMRWSSTVEGNNDIAKYYAIATNEFVNGDFFQLQRHKKLQWLLCCTVSPNTGKQKHYWLGSSKRENKNPLQKVLSEQFPHLNPDEIKLLLKINTREEVKEWLLSRGLTEKEIINLWK